MGPLLQRVFRSCGSLGGVRFCFWMGLCAWHLVCAPASRAADDGAAPPKFHEFTSTDGKSFKGQIQNVVDDLVIIKREDGQIFKVKPGIFSSADQTFIEAWMAQQTKARQDVAFNIVLSAEKTAPTLIANPDAVITTTQWTEGYSLKLESQLPFTSKNLTVRYIMFKTAADAHVKSGVRPTAAELMGRFVVPELKPRTPIKLSTAKATMTRNSLPPKYYWTSGAPSVSADRLQGLWVRIYDSNDQLIFEWSSAGDAIKNLPWDSIWADQPTS